MLVVVQIVAILLGASTTFVPPIAIMGDHVLLEGGILAERLATLEARKRFLAGVDHEVTLEVVASAESALAQRAGKLFACDHAHLIV